MTMEKSDSRMTFSNVVVVSLEMMKSSTCSSDTCWTNIDMIQSMEFLPELIVLEKLDFRLIEYIM